MNRCTPPLRGTLPNIGLAGLTHTLRWTASPAASAPPAQYRYAFDGDTMGTTYHVRLALASLDDTALLDAARAAVDAAVQGVDQRMSTYRADSELSQLNRYAGGRPFALSADTISVLQMARSVSLATDGAFDITAGSFVNLWGFGPEKAQRVVTPYELAMLKSAVGTGALEIDPRTRTATKADPRVYADLSAIAKGFGVDQAAIALDALGISDYMVEVGGEVRAKGRRHDGRAWQIGIEEPQRTLPRRARFVVPLRDMAMATSGDYRICFEQDGQHYSHEIDPRTGRPIANGLTSVTVAASQCAIADAYATALIVLGPERGVEVAEQLGLAAYFVLRDVDGRHQDRMTTAFAALGGRPATTT